MDPALVPGMMEDPELSSGWRQGEVSEEGVSNLLLFTRTRSVSAGHGAFHPGAALAALGSTSRAAFQSTRRTCQPDLRRGPSHLRTTGDTTRRVTQPWWDLNATSCFHYVALENSHVTFEDMKRRHFLFHNQEVRKPFWRIHNLLPVLNLRTHQL